MARVVFDPAAFKASRPQFAKYSDERLNRLFSQAEMFVDNTPSSPIPYDPPERLDRGVLLDLLVCHMATLEGWEERGAAGPLTNASQGDVSASFGTVSGEQSAAMYNQTPCGQLYWTLSRRWAMRAAYVRAPRRVVRV